MECVIEYLSVWPPPESSKLKESPLAAEVSSLSDTIPSEPRSPPPKRLKHELEGGADELTLDKSSCPDETDSHVEELEHRLSVEELHIVHCHFSVSGDALVARWWKTTSKSEHRMAQSESRDQRVVSVIKSNAGPQTQLYHISRLQKAKIMLQCRVHHLKSLITSIPVSEAEELSFLHISIATCYKRLAVGTENTNECGYISSALKHCKLALELDSKCEEGIWLSKLLERQQDVEIKKKLAMERLSGGATCTARKAELSMPKPAQVERWHVDDLTAKKFFHQYAVTHTPVIITGIVEHMTTKPWTLDYIKHAIGDKCAPLKRMVHESVSWAKLEPAGESAISTFIELLDKSEESDLQYLFDWSLPINCPDLVKELKIPKYFASDYLQRTPPGSLYQDSWPSLFIAPAGITSELHVDAFGSNFWMALFQGQKRWLFFPPDDVPLLYPVFNNSTDATFEVDLSSPDLTPHPLLALTHPRECILKAGELLFVPAGCPHRVENLTKSLAISANFVDRSNVELVLEELSVNAIQDQRAAQLWSELQGARFNGGGMEEVDVEEESTSHCVHWDQFKSRIRN